MAIEDVLSSQETLLKKRTMRSVRFQEAGGYGTRHEQRILSESGLEIDPFPIYTQPNRLTYESLQPANNRLNFIANFQDGGIQSCLTDKGAHYQILHVYAEYFGYPPISQSTAKELIYGTENQGRRLVGGTVIFDHNRRPVSIDIFFNGGCVNALTAKHLAENLMGLIPKEYQSKHCQVRVKSDVEGKPGKWEWSTYDLVCFKSLFGFGGPKTDSWKLISKGKMQP